MPPGVLKSFPFSAVKGMEDVKKALLCVAVDDDLTGILIKGPTGTAKSVLVRSFVNMLPGKEIVNVPQNVTDEQLFGGLDIEDAIKHGRSSIKDGLLQRANGNILYIDNVNLFDTRMLASIMECVETGKVIVEREGISAVYDCKTTVIATMDPIERTIPDHIADKFDICAQTYSSEEGPERYEIVMANLEFDLDPDEFIERYSKDDEKVADIIISARERLKMIPLTPSDVKKISGVCIDLGAKGHRGDISVARVSRALAALGNEKAITNDHIKDAAVLCLLHRRRDTVRENIIIEAKEEEKPPEQKDDEIVKEVEEVQPDEAASDAPIEFGDSEKVVEEDVEDVDLVPEISDDVKERLEDMDAIEAIRLHKIAGKSGRRKNITLGRRSGRYRGFKMPNGRSTDPAFDATIRAAAPYQLIREDKGLSINIEQQDIREKIRVKKDSCSFLFAVDVSGSLVNSGMMRDIKDGVKAMLMDSYVHRDKVALMTFRAREIKIPVPFTRSVEGMCDIIENTKTGDGTPLGSAMLTIREYMMNYVRKNPEERCYVILITDGEATHSVIRGKDAKMELRKVAATMNIPNTEWIVVDSSLVPGRINYALDLAKMLNAKYVRLEDLQLV